MKYVCVKKDACRIDALSGVGYSDGGRVLDSSGRDLPSLGVFLPKTWATLARGPFFCYIFHMKLSETLHGRGFVYQFSSETLEEITDGPQRTVYLGVDPTADSIHAGNFAVYMLLRHFVDAGHKVILLIGGGTGMIGDPKPDVERPLTPTEVIKERSEKLAAQAKKILGADIEIVNNYDWLSTQSLIDFLRDIGKHFTVNNVMKKDAIAKRLASEEGITYTEFAYPLLQAYDFWHLFKTRGCDVQVSGSDQWGNVTAGIDLVRRKEGKQVYALTIPLVVDKATGKKFGKSEGNAVWLDPEKTSPYTFYQFWFNVSDENVEDYLKLFTLMQLSDIAELMSEHESDKGAHTAQKKLAFEVTALVHGAEAARGVETSAVRIFSATPEELTPAERDHLLREAPQYVVKIGESIVDVLLGAQLASSKREARQFIEEGAISLHGGKITDVSRSITHEDFQNADIAILTRGKKNRCVLTVQK